LQQYLAQAPVLQALDLAKQKLNEFLVMKCLKGKRAEADVARAPDAACLI